MPSSNLPFQAPAQTNKPIGAPKKIQKIRYPHKQTRSTRVCRWETEGKPEIPIGHLSFQFLIHCALVHPCPMCLSFHPSFHRQVSNIKDQSEIEMNPKLYDINAKGKSNNRQQTRFSKRYGILNASWLGWRAPILACTLLVSITSPWASSAICTAQGKEKHKTYAKR